LASGTPDRGFAPCRSCRIFRAFLRKRSKAICPMSQICSMLKIPKCHNKGVILAKLLDHSCPQFHLSQLGALALMGTWRHLVAKVGTSKGGGKQWQTTPKNLPRMQRARAIPVAWLGSVSCQNWPKGWILMMIMCLEHYFLILRRYFTSSTLYIVCMLCQLSAPGLNWN
jgi:hypothetical protein